MDNMDLENSAVLYTDKTPQPEKLMRQDLITSAFGYLVVVIVYSLSSLHRRDTLINLLTPE